MSPHLYAVGLCGTRSTVCCKAIRRPRATSTTSPYFNFGCDRRLLQLPSTRLNALTYRTFKRYPPPPCGLPTSAMIDRLYFPQESAPSLTPSLDDLCCPPMSDLPKSE